MAPTTISSSSSITTTADFSRLTSARWTLEYETGATGRGVWVALLCVLVLWLSGWMLWCYAVFFRKGAGGLEVRPCLCCLVLHKPLLKAHPCQAPRPWRAVPPVLRLIGSTCGVRRKHRQQHNQANTLSIEY